MVFYSLILLIILKFSRRPKITLLLFVAAAALYFLIYQLVFLFSPSGSIMSGLKFFQITLLLVMIIFEFVSERFVFDRKKVLKSIGTGAIMGLLMYMSFAGTLIWIYKFEPYASFQQARAGQILMRMGYSFPLNIFTSIVTETSDPYLLYDLIYYSRAYHRPINISPAEWENLILSGSMEVANIISFYLQTLNITVSYPQIMSYAERRSIDSGEILVNGTFYIRYSSRYCEENIQDMIERYGRQPVFKGMAYTRHGRIQMPFLNTVSHKPADGYRSHALAGGLQLSLQDMRHGSGEGPGHPHQLPVRDHEVQRILSALTHKALIGHSPQSGLRAVHSVLPCRISKRCDSFQRRSGMSEVSARSTSSGSREPV